MVNYAQRVGLETVRQGTLTFEPDEAVRAVMKTFGNLDQHFTHRLGHGAYFNHSGPAFEDRVF